MSSHIIKVLPSEVNDMVLEDDILLVDVRPYDMFKKGHIRDAVSLPYDSIDIKSAAAAIKSQDTPFVVYCKAGHFSQLAAERLEDMGYTSIYDMSGGLQAWPFGIESD